MIVTRRYMLVGPTTEQLVNYVAASAAVNATFAGPIVDIDIDDEADGAIDQLNLYMRELGWVYSPSATPP